MFNVENEFIDEDCSRLGANVLKLTGHVTLTLANWNQALSTLEDDRNVIKLVRVSLNTKLTR